MGKSFWKKIIKSCNPKYFKEIAFQPLRKSFKYLICLLIILALILSVGHTFRFAKGIQKIAKELPSFFEKLKDFPEITIEKGILTSPKEYYATKLEGAELIIDPGQDLSHYLAVPPPKGSIILLKDKVIVQQSELESRIYNLSALNYFNLKFKDKEAFLSLSLNGRKFSLTPEKVNQWAKFSSWIFFPIATIFIFIPLLTGKLIQIFGFSLISLIINKVKKVNLNYQSLLNIGIFSLTLPVILETVVKLSGISIPYFGLFNSGLYIAFLVIGILNAKTTVVQPFSK